LILTVYRLGFIAELAADAWDSGRKAAVHLKIDTGLNRFGVRPGEELAEAIFELKRNSDAVAVKGVFSHFAELVQPDDKKTIEQYERFLSAIQQLKAAGISTGTQHICASAAYEYHPEMALDAVRLGRKLYFDNPKQPDGLIEEAASWRALITDIKMRRAGEKIGYGDGFVLPCDTTVATLGVGYGDGLMTALVQKQAPVLIGGKRARLLQCCMDMCFADVSGIDCAIGDEATLFGRDAEGRQLSAREVAALIGDEGCTLTSALGNRVLRVYI